MIDLDEIPVELLRLRGSYATVRGAHEDAVKELQKLCTAMQSAISAVLRQAQIDHSGTIERTDMAVEVVKNALDHCHALLVEMNAVAQRIESLAKQKAELKPQAWPKQ